MWRNEAGWAFEDVADKDRRRAQTATRASPEEGRGHRLLSHISVGVADRVRSLLFSDAVLAPLGFVRVWTAADAAGYGHPGGDDAFAIKQHSGEPFAQSPRNDIAFDADGHEAVRAFHAAALALGAVDDGAPEFCPEYGEDSVAAFVADPDGYRLEATAIARR